MTAPSPAGRLYYRHRRRVFGPIDGPDDALAALLVGARAIDRRRRGSLVDAVLAADPCGRVPGWPGELVRLATDV